MEWWNEGRENYFHNGFTPFVPDHFIGANARAC
jgi:hypothetical protein